MRLETFGDISGHQRSFPYNWVSLDDVVAVFASPHSMQSRKIKVGIIGRDRSNLRGIQRPTGAVRWCLGK